MKTLLEVLRLAESHLEERGVESARLNSERLLASVLEIDRLGLYLQFDRPLEESELSLFREYLRRRAAGEPLQYIVGNAAFRELSLNVGAGVLIPRPETEQLVSLVLERIDKLTSGNDKHTLSVLDLCTGSGAIGLALASERSNLWCVMTELSAAAAYWALGNYRGNQMRLKSPLSIVRSDLLEAFRERKIYDVIVSNPPYVACGEMKSLPLEVRDHEPHCALAAGAEGLDVIERIISKAPLHLNKGGLLAMEIGETQRDGIKKIFEMQEENAYTAIEFHRDLSKKTRFVTAYMA